MSIFDLKTKIAKKKQQIIELEWDARHCHSDILSKQAKSFISNAQDSIKIIKKKIKELEK